MQLPAEWILEHQSTNRLWKQFVCWFFQDPPCTPIKAFIKFVSYSGKKRAEIAHFTYFKWHSLHPSRRPLITPEYLKLHDGTFIAQDVPTKHFDLNNRRPTSADMEYKSSETLYFMYRFASEVF